MVNIRGTTDVPKLPSNTEKVLGEGPLAITDAFASLKALFKTAIYGPLNTWSEFWEKAEDRASLMSQKDRLKLYNSIKGTPAWLDIAQKVYSQEEAQKSKAANNNLRAYEVLKTSISKEDFEAIKSILPKDHTHIDADQVVSLKKIARDPNISRDVRKLINQKLNNAAKNTTYIEYIPENPNFYRDQMLKRAAITIAISAILGLGIYYSKIPTDLPKSSDPIETFWIWTRFQNGANWVYNQTDNAFDNAKSIRDATIYKIVELYRWLSSNTDQSIIGFRSTNDSNISYNELLSMLSDSKDNITNTAMEVWSRAVEADKRPDEMVQGLREWLRENFAN